MKLKLFSFLDDEFGDQVAESLSVSASPINSKIFEDGEHYIRSKDNIRGCDVYVVARLHSDDKMSVGEKLMSLCLFIGSLKDASAEKITLVIPMIPYARQDRKTESRAPISTKYVAQMLEAMGVSRLMAMDVHNLAALQNAFRIPTDNLEGKLLFVDFFARQKDLPRNLVVLSPDSGGMSRTRLFRTSLEKRVGRINQIGIAYFDKERDAGTGALKGDKIIGEVKDRDVIIIDDMISTGGTIQKSVESIISHGGRVYAVLATHGLFIGDAVKNLNSAGNANLIITDTIPAFRIKGDTKFKLNVVNTAGLFARAIRRNHDGDSISELLED